MPNLSLSGETLVAKVGKPMTEADYDAAMAWALPEAPSPR